MNIHISNNMVSYLFHLSPDIIKIALIMIDIGCPHFVGDGIFTLSLDWSIRDCGNPIVTLQRGGSILSSWIGLFYYCHTCPNRHQPCFRQPQVSEFKSDYFNKNSTSFFFFLFCSCYDHIADPIKYILSYVIIAVLLSIICTQTCFHYYKFTINQSNTANSTLQTYSCQFLKYGFNQCQHS